tara:strand:- start:6186 stop:6857 length:672 start_codon:yes stop_codon:yes gene_type:complete
MNYYTGDLHGRLEFIKQVEDEATKSEANLIIQVGDFGIHFREDCEVAEWFNSREGGLTWVTCGGNHDNWPKWREQESVELFGGKVKKLASGCFFADRNTILNIGGVKHLFFGGAESTDKALRVEGESWWHEETPNQAEALDLFDAMLESRPEVVVSHDAPSRIELGRMNRDTAPTPRMLENVLKHSGHKPKRWYFGHHHVKEEWILDSTTFYCCGLHGDYIVT